MKGSGALPRRIHMVGIGGIGLSAIARVLAAWGHAVTGSDLRTSSITEELKGLGVEVHEGHAARQINGAELVVMSSAIPEDNPEIVAARRAGIPVLKRKGLLTKMMAGSFGIAVAGTHGKTTTASMISFLLERLGHSPTFIVGGIITELGTNARAGRGKYFVIEADEYDRMFHGLEPRIAVVTNIEMDHPDCYDSIEDLRAAFGEYLERVPRDGRIVACADSPELTRVLAGRERGAPLVVTYGLSPDADYLVEHVRPNHWGGVDYRVIAAGVEWGSFSLRVPGVHNALNATAALAVADLLGIDRTTAGHVLASFRGVSRRFELKGERHGIVVVDDYAHHPTEVRATLAAARLRYAGRRLWAVFQPHTYSRVRALLAEFATCFGHADEVIVTDIYAARWREKPVIRATDLVRAIQHERVRHMSGHDQVVAYLLGHLRGGDVLITLGAGDSYLIGERVLRELLEEGSRCEK